MGSGSSRLETRWWEVEAQRKVLTTKNTGKVEVICSLIPGVDEVAMVGYLKARFDLDTLFALHCKHEDLSKEQRADPSTLTVDFKANELWRALRMLQGYGDAPWNWQPPFEGIPSEIAAELHAVVCQAPFRIPFFDFVKYALGYTTKARFLNNLLDGVCDIRDGLRREFISHPQVKEIYVAVEKALEQSHHPLAHWIIASSLHHSVVTLSDTLAPNLEPIRAIFEMRDFDLVLTRLAALDQRFAHGSQMYNWQKWSTDLEFWQCVDRAIWSGKMTTLVMSPQLSREDCDGRLRFLKGFEHEGDSSWRKTVFLMKRLIGRDSQYKERLAVHGPAERKPKRS